MRLVRLLLFWFSLNSLAVANPNFDSANRAYEASQFAEAKQGYQKLISEGEGTANIYYNLGNALYRLGETGPAVLAFERTLALDPGHSDARANLKFLREQSMAKVPEKRWTEYAFSVCTFDRWVLVASGAIWAIIFIVLLPFVLRRRMGAGGIFALILSMCTAGYATTGAYFTSRELAAAVVITKQVEARRAPADLAELSDQLPAGSRVTWLGESGGWAKCTLPDGRTAWVPSSSIERVRVTTASS